MKNKIKQVFYDYIEDFLIFLGVFLIVFTTFLLNLYIGMYILGAFLIFLGIYIAKFPPRRR